MLMNISNSKQQSLRAIFTAIIVCALGMSTSAPADDTDIYLTPSVALGSEPLVMFVLDWRPNLGSTVGCGIGTYCDDMRADGFITDGNAAGSGASTTFFDVLRGVLKKVLAP